MIKKTITYTDYNGVKREEEHYFNLNKVELMEMEANIEGGIVAMLKEVSDANDSAAIIRIMKDLILMSYGEKSADGKRFVKSPVLAEAFSQTEAFTELFMELATNADAAANFVNGIIPADMTAQLSAVN